MKKTLLFVVFFVFLALIIPGTRLFADISLGGRIDAGVDLFTYFPIGSIESSEDNNSMSMLPILPLFDLGAYGQFSTGFINLGVGIRGFSLIYINVFWPSFYAELNIWRFSLNAQLGGGAFYIFPIYLMTGPYFVPELSLWFKIITFNKADQMRVGVGAISLLSTNGFNKELFQDFSFHNLSNRALFYVALKFTFPYPWMTWKREQ